MTSALDVYEGVALIQAVTIAILARRNSQANHVYSAKDIIYLELAIHALS